MIKSDLWVEVKIVKNEIVLLNTSENNLIFFLWASDRI